MGGEGAGQWVGRGGSVGGEGWVSGWGGVGLFRPHVVPVSMCQCLHSPSGTFGEKWQISHPLQPSQLPHKVPADISNSASFNTLNVASGPPTSKWTYVGGSSEEHSQ